MCNTDRSLGICAPADPTRMENYFEIWSWMIDFELNHFDEVIFLENVFSLDTTNHEILKSAPFSTAREGIFSDVCCGHIFGRHTPMHTEACKQTNTPTKTRQHLTLMNGNRIQK